MGCRKLQKSPCVAWAGAREGARRVKDRYSGFWVISYFGQKSPMLPAISARVSDMEQSLDRGVYLVGGFSADRHAAP